MWSNNGSPLCLLIFAGLLLVASAGYCQNRIDSLREHIKQMESAKRYRAAIQTSQIFLDEIRRQAKKSILPEAYLYLARNNYKIGRTKTSLKYYKLYVMELEDRNNSAQAESFYRQKAFYESEVKALQLEISRRDQELNKLKNENEDLIKKSQLIYYGLWTVLVIAALLFLGWSYQKFKRRIPHPHIKEREEIQKTQEELKALQLLVEKLSEQKNSLEIKANVIDLLTQKICQEPSDYPQKLKYVKKSFVFSRTTRATAADQLWLRAIKGYLMIGILDVPFTGPEGGLLAELALTHLDNLVLNEDITAPSILLNKLDHALELEFPAGIPLESSINIGVATFEASTRSITYSGATVSLYALQDHVLTEYPGDNMGLLNGNGSTDYFSSSVIQLDKRIRLYFTTDGFWKQTGGKNHAPFKKKAFEKMLQSLSSQKFEAQKAIIEKVYDDWKGAHEQTDDVLVAGFEF